MNNQNHHFY